jgi:hypothetical protein
MVITPKLSVWRSTGSVVPYVRAFGLHIAEGLFDNDWIMARARSMYWVVNDWVMARSRSVQWSGKRGTRGNQQCDCTSSDKHFRT